MTKQIKTLFVVFVVLAGAAYFFANPFGADPALSAHRALFDFKSDDVGAFKIANFMEGFEFKRDGDVWLVKAAPTELSNSIAASDNDATPAKGEKSAKDTGSTDGVEQADAASEAFAKADPVKIASLLTNITELKTSEPIASEAGARNLFQINPHSLSVMLYDKQGAELAQLFIGKNGPDFMSTYVARGDENDVFLVAENIKGLTTFPLEEWLFKEEKKDDAAMEPAVDEDAADKTSAPLKSAKKATKNVATKNKAKAEHSKKKR